MVRANQIGMGWKAIINTALGSGQKGAKHSLRRQRNPRMDG